MRGQKIIWTSIILGAVLWIVDSVVDALLFHEQTLESQIFAPPADEMASRTFTAVILIISGILVQVAFNRRKKVEEALKNSEGRYRILSESTHDRIFIIGRDFNVRYVNESAARQLGLYPADVIGRPFHELFSPEDRAFLRRDLSLAFDSGKPVSTVKNIRFQGRGIWHDGKLVPIADESGAATEVMGISRGIIDCNSAEDELRSSELQLAEAQRVAHIGSWERDIATNKVIWSDELFRIFGVDPHAAEPTYELLLNIIHPDDRDSFIKAGKEAVYGNKPYSFDFRILRKDGTVAVIHSRGEVVCDETGKAALFRGTVQDITERKQMEDALRAAIVRIEDEKARSEGILAAIGDGISIQDTDFRVLYQNQIHKNHVGDHVGELCYRAYEKRDRRCEGCPVEMAFEDGTIHTVERSAPTDQGTLYAEITASPLRDSTGKIIAGIEVARDITGRKKMEEQILQTKHDWEDAFNTLTDMITVHDKDFNIIRSNKAADKVLSLPLLNITKAKCYEYYHGTECPPNGCPSCRSLKTGELSTTEIYEPHLGLYLEIRAIPRFDSDHQMAGLIHVVRDITEQKKAEEEKAKLETQLRQAQKMEAIGLLAGGIAHDFNNILTAIIGYGNLLWMKIKDNDQLRGYAEQVLESSERAARLTRSILAFSRKQILNPKPVDLNEIIGRVEKLLAHLIGEDIKLKAVLTGADLTVLADSGQIEQVLMNLATNARDAMPNGGSLIIETSTVQLDEHNLRAFVYDGKPGSYAMISVTDTGAGFDEKTRERIFEPFFTTKEAGQGTGLGLSIVYGIIKQHGGHISVYSEPGKGTTFRIYLPVLKKEIAEATTAEPAAIPAGGSEMILLAEDDESVRRMTKLILEEFGYTVIEAGDGDVAISKFMENKDRIKLLIFDVVMPNKNGKEAYDEIRKLRPAIRAIFTSGYTADIIHQKGILEEGLDFISKPVAPIEILKMVRDVLDR